MNILSLGAGVQSSTVLLMSCRGVLPRLDGAIFADTQWEPAAVYRWLYDVLKPEAEKAGIPLYVVTAGNLRSDYINAMHGDRVASMPLFFNGGEGRIRRQCTQDYKISPINHQIGLLANGPTPKDCKIVQLWFGISADEMRRVRTSRKWNIQHYYPLIFGFDRPWHRHDCEKWLLKNGYGEAPRSACIGCPNHSDAEWRRIKAVPDEWADAVSFDAAIRHQPHLREDAYLHRSCKPLPLVDLESLEDKGQQNWLNECEGMCGV